MAVIGGFERSAHLSELADPLPSAQGVLTPTQRRNATVQNMLGDSNITITDLLVTDVATAGDVENEKAIVAAASDEASAIVDFSGLTLADGARLIRGICDFEAVTGWLVFSGNAENDAFRYSAYFQPQTSSSAKLLGIGNTAILQSGASVNVAEAAQLHVLIQSGATITTRGGDPTAGVHPIWAKIDVGAGSTIDSGARLAPIWADIQNHGVDVSGGELFGVMITNTAVLDAVIRHNYSGDADATYFLQTGNGLGSGCYVSSGYDTTQSNNPSGFIVVDIGGTAYGIPLMAAS